jgi:plastocyanin
MDPKITTVPTSLGMAAVLVVVASAAIIITIIMIITTLTFSPISPAFGTATISANITSGAASKTTDAFSPNPLNVKVGDTVTWTNDDLQPHTVTSGTSAIPDGRFDSSPGLKTLLTSKNTFSHTFNQTGTFPYFCQLHPNMIGTVNVSSSGNGGTNTPEFPVITIWILGGSIAAIIAYSRFARNNGVEFSKV